MNINYVALHSLIFRLKRPVTAEVEAGKKVNGSFVLMSKEGIFEHSFNIRNQMVTRNTEKNAQIIAYIYACAHA